MFFNSPGVPTYEGEVEQKQDVLTNQLFNQLRSKVEQEYTQPSYKWAFGLQSGLDDRNQSVGYKQVPVDNQVSVLQNRFEAPEVPVTQLPFQQNLYNSTLVQETVNGKILYKMRSPGINEIR